MSSDPAVATVDNVGNVTGISEGTAILSYNDANTGCPSGTLTVTVIAAEPVSITGVDELCIGETSTLSPTTGGVWQSNEPTIASVDNGGNVIALSIGSATFTFTSTDIGGCVSTETAPITVNGAQTIVLDDLDICLGETANASTTAVGTWVSNNTSVATIDPNTGVITSVGVGTATFTFTNTATTCVSDESAVLTVSDIPSTTLVGSDEICVGQTTQFFPTVGGIWTSSDPSIASIENNGLVTAVSSGGPITFTWTSNLTGCVSSASDPITVNSRSFNYRI